MRNIDCTPLRPIASLPVGICSVAGLPLLP